MEISSKAISPNAIGNSLLSFIMIGSYYYVIDNPYGGPSSVSQVESATGKVIGSYTFGQFSSSASTKVLGKKNIFLKIFH